MEEHNADIVVVIPVYKSKLTKFEIISFTQCCKVLKAYEIFLVAPKNLDVSVYQTIKKHLKIKYISPKWMQSIEMYNKLKLSKYFYGLFSDYKFLLTYELDAFVFKDDLDYWVKKNIDYIGAPWFKGYANPENEFLGVGNSGFSLRNINTFKKVLNKTLIKDEMKFLIFRNNKFVFNFIYWVNRLMVYFGENYTIQNSKHLNEDAFVSQVIVKKYSNFKLASIEDAYKFSFEVKPEYLYKLNNNQLPTGCHAWWKYNLKFWKPIIENYGYNLNIVKWTYESFYNHG